MSQDQWLTVEQIATRMQVTPETVRRWLRSRKLRGVRLSDKAGWRVRASDLDRYIVGLMPAETEEEEATPKMAEAA
jgi:excisionase family DNA binding protein